MLPLLLLLSTSAIPAKPLTENEVARLSAIFAGGVLDLIAEPKRDVTVSFATLVSAPIGYPKEKRAAELGMIATSLDEDVRAINPKVSAEAPALVNLCIAPESGTRWMMEALVQGKSRAWVMKLMADTNLLGTPATTEHPPQIFFAELSPLASSDAERLRDRDCHALRRDEAGQVYFDGEDEPLRFTGREPTPYAAGSDHLLDFALDPDLAVAGLMPAQVFGEHHTELPRPRAAGVLNLIATAEVLAKMGGLTTVASQPSQSGTAVFFVEGRPNPTVVSFNNGYFTTPKVLAPSAAVTGKWSSWSWSLADPRMPAELVFDLNKQSSACLDALPKSPSGQLAVQVQKCLDLSLKDASTPFKVRRERWLEAVQAHETAAENTVAFFCADQRALTLDPFFRPVSAAARRDAGALMTSVLGWEEKEGAKKVPGSLQISAEVAEKFSADGFMARSKKDLALAARVDTSFFTKLSNFDRWELVDNGGPLTSSSTLNAAKAPLPRFGLLNVAARVHLRRGHEAGRLIQAAREVRQAAKLAFNSENLVGQALAVNLLSIEWKARDWAFHRAFPTAGWDAIPLDVIERARRVVRTAPAYFSPMTDERTVQRALDCDRLTVCSAYSEVAAISAGLESLLREPWRSRYGATLSTIAKPNERCSFSLARYWAARPMLDVKEAKGSRVHEVIAGGMMSKAATGFTLPALDQFYVVPLP